jgi:hypothetical protein
MTEDELGYSGELMVWVGNTITDHDGLEVELGDKGCWGQVQSSVVVMDDLYRSAFGVQWVYI